ncbi:GNAT family N-acetyltransferase [bacterium]|nr:GNAT family N-acetyltransferase [bacterium]
MTEVIIRNTRPEDFEAIAALCRIVYPDDPPWGNATLGKHLEVFPEGQFVAEDRSDGRILGMAASLIVLWDDYERHGNWREFTDAGMFTNHDPEGHTLYGAEVMVHPDSQGKGIGRKIYAARRELVRQLGLLRIRAGARLRGYHRCAGTLSAEEYVLKVVKGELHDPTLTFQLKQEFRVLYVVDNYLRYDEPSQGYAAVIEWINPEVAKKGDYAARDPKFSGPFDEKLD